MTDSLPALPGTYAIVLRLAEPRLIAVGLLGISHHLTPGLYVYVGSALGPGGLRARITRHLRRQKRPHWHIDGLTNIAHIVGVWLTVSSVRWECAWACALAELPSARIPIPGFGSTDCRCPSHLLAI